MMISLTLPAQEKYKVYCEVTYYTPPISLNSYVYLNIGDKRHSIYADNGKRMKFGSTIQAINYMAKRGWKLHGTYIYYDAKEDKVIKDNDYNHFIMVKEVSSDDEIFKGINIEKGDKQDKDK